MGIYDALHNVQDEINKCMKCGNCQAVCPIYHETRKEPGVARGKIVLIKDLLTRQEVTTALQEKLALCLTCKACNVNCPCGVKVDRIIMAARAETVRKKGLPFLKRFIFGVLNKPTIFHLSMKSGSIFQSILFKKHQTKKAGYPRFPIGLDNRRIVPSLADTSLTAQVEEVNPVKGQPQLRAAFFVGCVTNYIYTDTGKAIIDVLLANNVEVVVPKAQHCCGLPVLAHGDAETARQMAKSHVDMFLSLKTDVIVTACASCGGAWKKEYHELLKDDAEYGPKINELLDRFYDITEFLANRIELNKGDLGTIDVKVTYHDPCHLARGQGIKSEPRKLITAIPGVNLVEMKAPDRCCGGAGSFSLTNYDLSMAIHQHKADDIRRTNTDIVLTSCPGCRMQLEDGVNMYQLPHPVLHVVQLLDKSYKTGKNKLV